MEQSFGSLVSRSAVMLSWSAAACAIIVFLPGCILSYSMVRVRVSLRPRPR